LDRLASEAPVWPACMVQARAVCEAQGLEPGLFGADEASFALAGSLSASRPQSIERIRYVERDSKARAMTLSELLERLARPFPGRDGSTGFSEFLWSAACEQNPTRRLADRTLCLRSEQSFRALFDRLSGPLRANLEALDRRRRFPPGSDPEQILNDTWSLAYQAYWSPAARSRLLGQATILTLLNCIARRLVRPAQRDLPAWERALCLSDVPEPIDPDPWPGRMDASGRQVIEECLHSLPPRCRIVAHLYFVKGHANSEIARRLRIERAAVSNHLKKAEQRLRQLIGREAGEFAGA